MLQLVHEDYYDAKGGVVESSATKRS